MYVTRALSSTSTVRRLACAVATAYALRYYADMLLLRCRPAARARVQEFGELLKSSGVLQEFGKDLDQESGSRVQERLSSGVLHAFYLGLTRNRIS
jgi:hypothetical protein